MPGRTAATHQLVRLDREPVPPATSSADLANDERPAHVGEARPTRCLAARGRSRSSRPARKLPVAEYDGRSPTARRGRRRTRRTERAPWAMNAAEIASLHVLHGERVPVAARATLARPSAAWRSSEAAAAIPASAATCARRMPASSAPVFDAAPVGEEVAVRRQLDPGGTERVGGEQRERRRHDRPLHAERLHGAQVDLVRQLAVGARGAAKLVEAELLGRVEGVLAARGDDRYLDVVLTTMCRSPSRST